MRRIAIAGFQHETNTFAPGKTTLDEFTRQGSWPALTRGKEIFRVFEGLNIPISGFINSSKDQLFPIIWAMAEPGGYVSDEAFDEISNEIVNGIEEIQPDAAYLDLHGAMATQKFDDGEAEILRRIKDVMGENFPVAISLDLHANISKELFELANVISIYRSYPHTDFFETGSRAAHLLEFEIEVGLAKSFRQIDFLIPITAQSTEYEPAKSIYAELSRVRCTSVDLAMGFPPADIPNCGASIVAYDPVREKAEENSEYILKLMCDAETKFDPKLVSAKFAVKKALSLNGPVIIADPQDNPGAGGTGDTTGILSELIEAKVTDAILAVLHDPETAKAAKEAGIDADLAVSLGGRERLYSEPLNVDVTVMALSEGKFTCTGPVAGGSKADLGTMARLQIKNTGIQVVVGSNRCQNWDQEFFRVVDIEPAEHHIICVKSAVHFIADYKNITDKILFAVSPGANLCQLSQIPFSRIRPNLRF